MVAHRPMYCSNSASPQHCDDVNNYIRTGIPYKSDYGSTYMFPPEKLFYQQGVDLLIFGHEHSYERMLPVYNREVCNKTSGSKNSYMNPNGPVHIVAGTGV